jgi:hypothetical protein
MDNWIDQARKQREIDFEPKYGPIRPRTDSRCFRREMIEDLLDALNYNQWAKEKGEINRHQWKKMDSGIRSVIRCIEAACNERFLWETDIQKVLNEAKQAEMI